MTKKEKFQKQYRLDNPFYNYIWDKSLIEAPLAVGFLSMFVFHMIFESGPITFIGGVSVGVISFFLISKSQENFNKAWEKEEEFNNL